MESILSDLARSGTLLTNGTEASKYSKKAISLLEGKPLSSTSDQKNKLPEAESTTISLLASLFVEATRQKLSLDEFASACSDYFSDSSTDSVTVALKKEFSSLSSSSTQSSILEKLHSSFYADLPHVVGVSSTVQHHVRDFSIKVDPGAVDSVTGQLIERPRSVANFVFSLDLQSQGILSSSSSSSATSATEGNSNQVVFQCTAEQAQELANQLRQAAAAMQRVEARVNAK